MTEERDVVERLAKVMEELGVGVDEVETVLQKRKAEAERRERERVYRRHGVYPPSERGE